MLLVTVLIGVGFAVPPASPAASPTPGCRPNTFTVLHPAGWQVEQVEDSGDGREGCQYVQLRPDSKLAGVVRVESAPEGLPLFRQGDPVATLIGVISEGMAREMNVLVGEPVYANQDLKRAPGSSVDRAVLVVFAATVKGDPRAHEVTITVMHAPGRYFTVWVVSPAESADGPLYEACRQALREVLNSLSPVRAKP
jgi:hypothetical protein